MKKKISMVFTVLILMLSFSSCSDNKNNMSLIDNSKVLANVDNIKITQHQVDIRKKDSEFSQQERAFSDKEVLDKIIEEQLLLIKAKELNITMSDKEVKENYKGMLEQMSSKQYVKGDEDKIDKNTLEALRNTFIIQRTKEKLGSDIDQTIKQLKQEVKIKYYD